MTDKSARYDRQLRLWGEDGQHRLENTRVLLLTASATGAETIKNLVLPGIGSFTVVDGKKVDASDLGTNFFVTSDSIGQPRAKVVAELLLELNPQFVKGDSVEEDPIAVIENKPDFIKSFTFVVASQLPEFAVVKLAQITEPNNIPLVVVRSYGLFGYLRVDTPEHTIVESKLDNAQEDLRMFNPWPELAAFANEFKLDELSESQHAHVPYIALLIQFLNKWRKEHAGSVPESRADKELFKATLKKAQKKIDEDNFDEAVKNAHKAFAPVKPSSEVQTILRDPKLDALDASASNFWILAGALKEFVESEGQGSLPVSGVVPDMAADTETFIRLQTIFQDKANSDIAAITARATAIAAKLGKGPLPADEVKQFCKFAPGLQVIRYKSIPAEYSDQVDKAALASALNEGDTLASLYVLFRSSEAFYTQHKRYPGNFDDEVASDVKALTAIVGNFCKELGLDAAKVKQDLLQEIVRFGGSELHSVAALMGGVASQEILKLITGKWIPLNHTLLYNGQNNTTSTIRL